MHHKPFRFLWPLFLAAVILFVLAGCKNVPSPSQKPVLPSPSDQNPPAAVPAFDLEMGKSTLDNYLQAVIRRNQPTASRFLTPQLAKTGGLPMTSNPHFTGYRIRSMESVGETGSFRVQMDETYTSQTVMAVREYQMIVVRQGESYLVDRISPGETASITERQGSLLFAPFGQTSQQDVFRITQIPATITPPGLNTDIKFGVGREGFGPVSLSPSLDRLLISTLGAHGFLGMINLADQQLMPLDLYFESQAANLVWSPNGASLAAVISTAAGANSLILYDAATLHRINTHLADQFIFPLYSLRSPYWVTPQRLCFLVDSRQDGASKEIKSLEGWWALDLDTGNIGHSEL